MGWVVKANVVDERRRLGAHGWGAGLTVVYLSVCTTAVGQVGLGAMVEA